MAERDFETKLKCAVGAGWCTLIVGILLITLSWVVFLIAAESIGFSKLISALWGGMPFREVRPIWLHYIAVAKMILFAGFLVVLFLTIWLKNLRKAAPAR